MRHRVAVLLVLVLLFSLCAWAQSAPPAAAGPPPQEPPKKKAHKVWTNEDFGSAEAAEEPKEEAKPAEGAPQPAEALFAELDQAREDLARWQQTLELYRTQRDRVVEKWRNADNNYDRDVYGRSVEAADAQVAEAEQTIKDLQARVAELESRTKGMKRPKAKPVEKKAEEQPAAPPAEMVPSAGGPIPTKEGQPPPPPPPPSSF